MPPLRNSPADRPIWSTEQPYAPLAQTAQIRGLMRAVVRNEAVVPVTPEAKGARALSRLAPGLLRAAARIKPRI
jgi:hypothetical protein